MRLQRVAAQCECCGRWKYFYASQYVFDAKDYCSNCNRPLMSGLEPCDHKPWRRRFNAMEAARSRGNPR